jgi:hypothetical protein
VRAADSAVKADRSTDLRSPGLWARLLEGKGAGEAGQWASSVRTGGGAGPRAAREWPGRRRRNRGGRARGRRRKGEGLPTGGVELRE